MNVLLVDSAMVYAASKSAPHLRDLARSDGYPTGAVFGFVRMVESQVKKNRIDRVYICQEAGGTQRKRELFPEYKSGREHSTAAVMEADHATLLHEWAMARGCQVAWSEGHEADDVIAELARTHRADGDTCVILSKDHDFHALLDEHTRIVWSSKVKDEAWFLAEYGFSPSQYAAFLALAGDPTDSVPRLMMPAKAKRLVQMVEEAGGEAIVVAEEVDPGEFTRNLELVTMGIAPDATVGINAGSYDMLALRDLYERLEFNSLMDGVVKLKGIA